MDMLSASLLSLLVVNLGVVLGAGLYETRIVVPEWFRQTPDGRREWNADAARRMDVGLRFWVFTTTIPLTLLLLANGAGAWRSAAGLRGWWLAACAAVFLERVMTFSYFIPTMIALTTARPAADDAATARALRWVGLGHVRLALTASALFLALRALTLAAR